MLFNKNVKNFIDYLSFHYAKHDTQGEIYLSQHDIPDFDLEHLCAIISSNHKDFASEACGPDNEYFFRTMLPSLNQYMSNTFNKEYEMEFIKNWKEGIRKYYSNAIDELLQESLQTHSLNNAA